MRYVMPDVDYKAFTDMLLTVKTRDDFQVKVMGPFLEMLVSTTTAGLSVAVWKTTHPDGLLRS